MSISPEKYGVVLDLADGIAAMPCCAMVAGGHGARGSSARGSGVRGTGARGSGARGTGGRGWESRR